MRLVGLIQEHGWITAEDGVAAGALRARRRSVSL
jgi:hypothetical protein